MQISITGCNFMKVILCHRLSEKLKIIKGSEPRFGLMKEHIIFETVCQRTQAVSINDWV